MKQLSEYIASYITTFNIDGAITKPHLWPEIEGDQTTLLTEISGACSNRIGIILLMEQEVEGFFEKVGLADCKKLDVIAFDLWENNLMRITDNKENYIGHHIISSYFQKYDSMENVKLTSQFSYYSKSKELMNSFTIPM